MRVRESLHTTCALASPGGARPGVAPINQDWEVSERVVNNATHRRDKSQVAWLKRLRKSCRCRNASSPRQQGPAMLVVRRLLLPN